MTAKNQSKKSRRREEMLGEIEKWKHSGLSQRRYCQEHNITLSTFSYWRKQYLEESVSTESGIGFYPLDIPPSGKETVRQVELDLPGGVVLRVIY